MPADPVRSFLRHAIATLAYRGTKIIGNAPAGFGEFRAADAATKTRSAVEILAHLGDLLDWTALLVTGEKGWHGTPPGPWEQEVGRFYAGLQKVEAALTSDVAPSMPLEVIFQGPIADAFTHLGQLALLRRLAGSPIRGEVMVLSDIVPGRVGPQQSPPVREFE